MSAEPCICTCGEVNLVLIQMHFGISMMQEALSLAILDNQSNSYQNKFAYYNLLAGQDYVDQNSTTITVTPGSAPFNMNYSVSIINDDALELEESFLVKVQAAMGFTDFTTLGDNHTVIIMDDVSDRGMFPTSPMLFNIFQ